MAKNVNLDKQVDGCSKYWGVVLLINLILFDVRPVTSLEKRMVIADMSETARHTLLFS